MKKYKVYSIITIIIWAMAYILTKIGLIYFSPLGLSVFRYVAASIFFLIVIFLKKVPFPEVKDIPWFFALGVTGFSIYVLTLADKTSEVSNFLFVSPLLTTIMGFFTLLEVPSIGAWIGGGIILFEKGK